MPPKQFEVTIRGTQNTLLEFENPIHEPFFEQLLAMKVCRLFNSLSCVRARIMHRYAGGMIKAADE
jgi:hypothetical protein